jgi:hypothetical protein
MNAVTSAPKFTGDSDRRLDVAASSVTCQRKLHSGSSLSGVVPVDDGKTIRSQIIDFTAFRSLPYSAYASPKSGTGVS